MKGYVHIYTGNGKGKTTAALGLAIRAAGAGLNVFLAQFIKGKQYSELNALKRLADLITVEQFGLPRFINGKPSEPDIEAARYGLERVKSSMLSGRFDMIIIDEGNVAVTYGLLSKQDLLDLIGMKPENLELIITGRDALPEIIDKADLVTEMKAITGLELRSSNCSAAIHPESRRLAYQCTIRPAHIDLLSPFHCCSRPACIHPESALTWSTKIYAYLLSSYSIEYIVKLSS
jgi:cob(I)alamin adenosyltransferase